MKARVNQTVLKRVAALEQRKDPLHRSKIVLLPKTLPLDEWEAIAKVSQAKLIELSRT
jgi:hypothetical protein